MSPLWASTLFGKTGEFAFEVVFAIITIELLEFDIAKIGLVYFFRLIPFLFFAPIGGAIADSISKKFVMVASDLFRAAILLVLFLLSSFDLLNVYVLVGLAMLITVGDSIYQPSFRASIPALVSRDDIPRANSSVQVFEDTSSILGPLLAAAIISLLSREFVLLVVSVLFALSMLSLFLLPRLAATRSGHPGIVETFREIRSTAVNLRRKNLELFMVILGTTVCAMFASAVLRYVFPAAVLGAYGEEAYVGYASAIIAVGTVCGGLLYTRVVQNPTTAVLMRSWMAYGVLFLAAALALNVDLYLTAGVLLLLGFSGALVDITIMTNIQLLSEEEEVGRNYGLYAAVANTGDALSGLVAGAFAFVAGAFSFPAMAASIAVAAAAVLSKLPKRARHEA
jgi:DHA3 family macrolide efflux protein-like MFS transporter